MGTTLRQLAGSIHVQLKQSIDNADVTFAQAVFWTSFFINKVRYSKLTLQSSKDGYSAPIDTGQYLSIYSDVPVTEFTANVNPNQVKGRRYFVLPAQVYNFDKDGGIDYITYSPFDEMCLPNWAGVKFQRTTPAKARRVYFSPYEKPAPNNPYWYRIGNYIYLLGIENIDISKVEVGLINTFDPFTLCNLDIEVGDEEMHDYITKSVLELGQFSLMIPKDTTNSGTDNTNVGDIPKAKIIGVNQQSPDQNTQEQ